MRTLKLDFDLFDYVHSDTVDKSPRLIKIQYYPNPTIKANLEKLHNAVIVPILKNFGSGYTLLISSGYRCKEYNDTLQGASKTSDHMLGYAADLLLFKNGKNYNKELFEYCEILKFKQRINEKKYSWVHISFDENNLKMQTIC